ncbi:sulfatase [Marinilongibacter aquaticus]|uniref:sulfatase family protein n=1 Tax=Marinilongibacter aquaticus TaxID=2975157 RepID=UPI0021BD0829|nr:sulfatase [Marinilongibacter aquaticus]UBM59146.1 sulfatase [Marinilongibacter aquaticus]
MKNYRKRACVFGLFFLHLFGLSAQKTRGPRPNILWITIEDTSPQFIGAYGNVAVSTPNIDKLAAEGVRFTNAFSTGTVCSPSRSAIITGVKTYKLGTGHHRSAIQLPDYIKGFPFYLQKAGYYTSNNSKTDYNISPSKEFIAETWHESSNKAGWWNRKEGQPFFAVFNFMDSHQSRTMTWSYDKYEKQVLGNLSKEEIVGEEAFDMPPIYHDSPEMRKQMARVYNSLKLTDNKIGDLLEKLEQEHLRDSTIVFFFADHGEGIPRGKTNGIDFGHRVPFVVWFPPMYRHLSPWGATGVVTDELIDFEDLAPTLISLAGGEIPAHLKGRVLMGQKRNKPIEQLFLSNDRSDNGPDLVRSVATKRFFYSRNFMAYEPELRYIRYMEIGEIKQQMRTEFKAGELNDFQESLFAPREPEQLYDIEQDPWQMHNLAKDPKYKSTLNEFRNALKKNVLKDRDVLFLPEFEMAQIAEKQTLYTFREDKKAYPLARIYQAAAYSGFRGEEIAQAQIKMLQDPNKIVRYWAALGLLAQPKAQMQAFKTELQAALQDDYPPVSITSAAILTECFNDQAGVEALKKACTDSNTHLALMALNYLLYVHEPAPFVQTVQTVKQEAKNYNVKAACNDILGKLHLIANDDAHESQ